MTLRRSIALRSAASRQTALISLLASAAAFACSAPPGADTDPDYGAPPFTGPVGSAGAGTGGTGTTLPNGSAGTGVGTSPTENTNNPNTPIVGNGGTSSNLPAGNGGTGQVPAGGTGGTASVGGTGGTSNLGGAGGSAPAAGGTGTGGTGAVTPPPPPGDAFFFDDFEGSTLDQSPANWDYFIAYVANQNNPSGNASALVDDTRAVSGTHSVHFVGGQSPAQITLPLPAGTNRLYVRAQVFMTRQLGANNNPQPNHETLIAIRGTPGQANSEVRFGEIKGVIGTNEVPSDNISPKQDQWGQGPAVAPNAWHCIEVQFLGDQADNQLFAYVDGTLVHSITAPDQWNNGNLGGNWMAGKFVEVVLGWHSFSGIQTDVWMDDIVLSNSPIGCN